MNTMADLTRRGVILYTPEGSNTTFVAPKLLKVLGESTNEKNINRLRKKITNFFLYFLLGVFKYDTYVRSADRIILSGLY